MEAREDQICEASNLAGLYGQSLKNCFNCIKQFVQQSSRVGNAQVEKPGSSSGGNREGINALTSLGDVGDDAGGGLLFA